MSRTKHLQVLAPLGECVGSHPFVYRPWVKAARFSSLEKWEGFGAVFFPFTAGMVWQIWQKRVLAPSKRPTFGLKSCAWVKGGV